jgi:hypothetical protein
MRRSRARHFPLLLYHRAPPHRRVLLVPQLHETGKVVAQHDFQDRMPVAIRPLQAIRDKTNSGASLVVGVSRRFHHGSDARWV